MHLGAAVALVLLLIWGARGAEVDCDAVGVVNEEHVHFCCKHPDIHKEMIAECVNKTGFKLPHPNEKSLVDMTAGRAISGTCFAKCVFDKLEIMKDDSLDMDVVRKYFTEQFTHDPEYGREMINAFDHCHGKTEENTAKFMSNHMFVQMSQQFCAPKSSVILACVIRQFFHNCPAERWSKTEECEKLLLVSRKCRDSLATL